MIGSRNGKNLNMDSPTTGLPDMDGLDAIASRITLNDGHNGDLREGR
jgi:hypothetical protein